MKFMNKAVVLLSLFAIPLFACGGSETDEGPESQELNTGAAEATETAAGDDIAQNEQALEFGRPSCNHQGRQFATCSAPIYHRASRGCINKNNGSIIWQESRNCWGCTDKGNYVTCWGF